MKFYRENWYSIGGVLFVILTFYMGLCENNFSHVQVILIYSFMALLVHQFEEYVCPGGFPGIFNIAVNEEKQVSDRYPLNANLSMIINVFIAYPFYIIPIFLPHVFWLGIAQVLFGTYQIIIHGVVINKKLKSIYNPGLASAVFLHLPIAIYYCRYVSINHLASTGDFIIGVVVSILFALVSIAIPIRLLRNRNSKYPFTENRMYRYAKEKVLKIKNS